MDEKWKCASCFWYLAADCQGDEDLAPEEYASCYKEDLKDVS